MLNSYSPVIIPTLNRYEHYKRCVESLERCKGAKNTELYIGLDYPPTKKYKEGWKKIVKYLEAKQDINGFKSLYILRRKENLGAVKNIEELKNFISEKFDRYIFSEDDNEFSPNFLVYVNEGLARFESNKNIYAICGYNYPIDMCNYENNYYLSQEFSAWGVGHWVKKDNIVNRVIKREGYLKEFCKLQPISAFLKDGGRLLPFIRYINSDYLGDVYITTYIRSNNMYCVFPTVSTVRNWGHDGTGVNCGQMDITKCYEGQNIQDSDSFVFDENVNPHPPLSVRDTLIKFRSTKFRTKIKNLLLLLAYKVQNR